MILVKGDMWNVFAEVDLFCITTNSTIRRDGALVMGRGIARQARDRFPGLDYELGKFIKRKRNKLYGFQALSPISIFQVKYNFWEKASLNLITISTEMLQVFIKGKNLQVALNFPGIGNGRLSREQVLPIISQLPDNVKVFEYE